MSPGIANLSSFPQIIAFFCSRIGRAVFNFKRRLSSTVITINGWQADMFTINQRWLSIVTLIPAIIQTTKENIIWNWNWSIIYKLHRFSLLHDKKAAMAIVLLLFCCSWKLNYRVIYGTLLNEVNFFTSYNLCSYPVCIKRLGDLVIQQLLLKHIHRFLIDIPLWYTETNTPYDRLNHPYLSTHRYTLTHKYPTARHFLFVHWSVVEDNPCRNLQNVHVTNAYHVMFFNHRD